MRLPRPGCPPFSLSSSALDHSATALLADHFSLCWQVLDKDGVFAAVRMAELIAYLDTKQMTLIDKLNDIYAT